MSSHPARPRSRLAMRPVPPPRSQQPPLDGETGNILQAGVRRRPDQPVVEGGQEVEMVEVRHRILLGIDASIPANRA